MGSGTSRLNSSIGDMVNRAITNVIINNSNSCQSGVAVIQDMRFGDITMENCLGDINYTDISQDSTINVNLSCSMSSDSRVDLKSQFSSSLDSEIDLAGKQKIVDNRNVGDTINEIKNNVDIRNISECASSIFQQQRMSIGNITVKCREGDTKDINIENLKQQMVLNVVSECVSKNTALMEAIANADSAIEQSLKTSSPLDLTTIIIISVVFIVVLILGIMIIKAFAKSKGGSNGGSGGGNTYIVR